MATKAFIPTDLTHSIVFGNLHSREESLPETRHTQGLSTLSVPVMGFWIDEKQKTIRNMSLAQLYQKYSSEDSPLPAINLWINLEERAKTKRYADDPPSHWMYVTKHMSYNTPIRPEQAQGLSLEEFLEEFEESVL